MFTLAQTLSFACIPTLCGKPSKRSRRTSSEPVDDPPPPEPPAEPDEPADPDELDVPCTDDWYWDVFIPDDDQYEPFPEPGDFWNDGFPNDE